MSDYISKRKLECDIVANLPQGRIKATYLEILDNQPTLDKKEIIRKPFERVVERLKELKTNAFDDESVIISDAIEIVKEECGINE